MVSPSSMCVYYVFLQPRTFLIGRMEIHCENVALKHVLPVPSSLTSYRRTTRTHRRPSPNLATSVVSLSLLYFVLRGDYLGDGRRHIVQESWNLGKGLNIREGANKDLTL